MIKMETDAGPMVGLSPAKRALLEKLRRGSSDNRRDPLAIRPRAAGEAIPLSFAQQRLWMIQQLDPNSTVYNVSLALRMTGDLRFDALERALNEMIRRHQVLRSVFPLIGDQPQQIIQPHRSLALDRSDLSALSAPAREAEAFRLASEEAGRPFDLVRGPLFRAGILRLNRFEHVLLLSTHHVVFDGWSSAIYLKELAALYQAFVNNAPSPLPEPAIQYADFALWQRRRLQGETLQKQIEYWRTRLAGSHGSPEPPMRAPRETIQGNQGARLTRGLPREISDGLRELSRRAGATLFMTTLAAFKTLLFRFTGEPDIVIGTPVAGRDRGELEGLIGVFINMLALRVRVTADLSFLELLERVREATLEAYANQDAPFERLVEELQPVRKGNRNPIFQIAFQLQNSQPGGQELPGLTLSRFKVDVERARFDLTLFVSESGPNLSASFVYNIDLFEEETIERISRHFEMLLTGVVADPQTRIGDLAMFSAEERTILETSTVIEELNKNFSF